MSRTSRDITGYRHEAKLVLPAAHLHRVAMWLRVHDAHFAPAYEPRWVNNVYFDTEEFAALNEAVEGQSRRLKVRLRWYGELERFEGATLEFKCKSGRVGWKRSSAITGAFDLRSQSWREIVRAVRTGAPVGPRTVFGDACRPALINRYYRSYFVSFDRDVRVTVDSAICFWVQSMGTRPNLRRPRRIDRYAVIEFKASNDCEALLSEAVHALGCSVGKHSKYVAGMAGSAQ